MAETRRTILKRIDRNLKTLLSLHPVKVGLRFGTPEKRDNVGEIPMADKTLSDIEKCTVVLEEDDAAGNPVPFDFVDPPIWQSSDPTVLTVAAATDGASAHLETTGKLGKAEVTVSGVVTDGRTITGIGTVDVVTSAPATFRLKFGDAEPRI
jgi:hypothetical protein